MCTWTPEPGGRKAYSKLSALTFTPRPLTSEAGAAQRSDSPAPFVLPPCYRECHTFSFLLKPPTAPLSSRVAGNPASHLREKRPATTAPSLPRCRWLFSISQLKSGFCPHYSNKTASVVTSDFLLLNPMARFPFPSYLTHQLHLTELILPPHCLLASEMPPSPGSPTSVASTPFWSLQLGPSHLSRL